MTLQPGDDTGSNVVDAAVSAVGATTETADTILGTVSGAVERYPIRTLLIAVGVAAVGGFVAGTLTGR